MSTIYPDKFPSHISASSRRRGERLLYTALSRSSIKGIRIYYSRLWRQVSSNGIHFNGEADFIVFIPPLGFLFIECKGGVVSSNSSGFFTQDKAGRTFRIKNPFEQAKRSMYSFINHVLGSGFLFDRNKLLSFCQYAAFFPESMPSNVFDNSFNLESQYSGFAADLSEIDHWLYKQFAAVSSDMESSVLSPREVGLIDSCLVPSGSFVSSPMSLAFEAEAFFEQPFSPTQNQYFVLQHLEMLSDVVVEGPAGSGKTLVGIEALKSRASTLGPPALFLCHSNELNDYYSAKYSSSILNAVFLSYSDLFAYLLQFAPIGSSSAETIVDLLSLAEVSFSSIIVDELQDFEPDFICELRSFCSESGLFLGLFDGNQSLLVERKEPLDSDAYGFRGRMFLFSNVRNSQEISGFVNRSCPGLPYANCLAPSGPSVVSWGKYTNVAKSFLLRLRRLIDEWNLNLSDVVVLVSNDADLELFSSFDSSSGCSYLDERLFPRLSAVRISTVFAFKGLEALCVIVWIKPCLLTQYEKYVAYTRARTLLICYE